MTSGAVKKLMEHLGKIFQSLELYLLPLARDKGVGQELLDKLEEQICATQVCLTSLIVSTVVCNVDQSMMFTSWMISKGSLN